MTANVADRFVVVLDANVLFPFRIRDVLLRFAEQGLFRARWSEEILDEWTVRLLELKPHLQASVESQRSAMQRTFPEACVTGYQALIQSFDLPDPKDRHVLAAAVTCGAQHIITNNLKDFPTAVLDPLCVEAVSPDDFLASTFELYPGEAMVALRTMRADYKNPSMTPNEFVLDLTAKRLVKLANLAKSEFELL